MTSLLLNDQVLTRILQLLHLVLLYVLVPLACTSFLYIISSVFQLLYDLICSPSAAATAGSMVDREYNISCFILLVVVIYTVLRLIR